MDREGAERVIVIGGINMDIGGSPAERLVLRDSNPGTVRLRPGGVGRNIAHNLRLLGLEVSLIAALGEDVYGTALRESCLGLGMDMSMAQIFPQHRSSTYLYVTDGMGDMHVGIADMEITECLTPQALEPCMARINAAPAVVVDANLPKETLAYLAAHCTAPLYADPVSTVKALRLRELLPGLAAIKPNALEAAALTGESDPEKAARALLALGVKRAFVSLGAEGMLAAEGEMLLRLPCAAVQVVNTTGAGDAATAALIWAGLRGFDLRRSAEAALLAGALTAEYRETNSPRLAELRSRLC